MTLDNSRIFHRTLTYSDWQSILDKIDAMIGKRGEYFSQGEVTQRDEINRLVWTKEFGDQPIPLIGFDYQVDVYDATPRNTVVPAVGSASPFTTEKHTYTIRMMVPLIGETVLIAKHLGADHLPKCLGKIQSTNYIGSPEE